MEISMRWFYYLKQMPIQVQELFARGHLCGINAFREACMAGHKKIVNLLLEPGHGVKRKGSTYEDAVLKAAHGYHSEDHGHVEIVKLLLAKGEFANLAQLRGDIIGEACLWGSEDVLRLVLENVASVRFQWRSWQTPLDIATARKHENIVQILLAHEANQGKGSGSSGRFRASMSPVVRTWEFNVSYGFWYMRKSLKSRSRHA
jgi:ankyrin repeat protein